MVEDAIETISDLTRERDALKEERDHYKNQLVGKDIEVKACRIAFDEIHETCLKLAKENARLTERVKAAKEQIEALADKQNYNGASEFDDGQVYAYEQSAKIIEGILTPEK